MAAELLRRLRLRLCLLRHHRLLSSSSSSSTPLAAAPPPPPTTTKQPKKSSSSPLKKAINSLFKERDLDHLVTLFKSSASHPRFRRRHSVHEVAVRRLALHGRLDAVADVLDTLKLYPADIAREGFAVRIISLYGKAGMPDHAAATFRDLPSLGCPTTVMSFNALLSAFVDSNAASRAVEFFGPALVENPGIVPDVFSYNILVHALCEMGEVDSAFGRLRSMEEEKGIPPNLITYNTLLRGFYRTGRRFEEAEEKVWSLMEEGSCVPDVRSFNEKLIAVVDRGMGMTEALKIVEEMRRRGLKLNTYSFNALIKGYCEDGSVGDAKMCFKELKKNDCLPNASTFEVLIPALCEAGDHDLAFRLCKKGMACLVEVKVLQQVVDMLVKASKLEEAKKLVEFGWRRHCYKEGLRMPESV